MTKANKQYTAYASKIVGRRVRSIDDAVSIIGAYEAVREFPKGQSSLIEGPETAASADCAYRNMLANSARL
jgi:hypothetical protein